MLQRLIREAKFFVEKQIVRGARFQLLFMALLIVFVSVIGGLLAYALTATISDFGDGVWWAFLRMSDPGYLGDDEGAVLRTISTVVTICGYVLFMGSLIAIMTQWLNSTMKKLESGVTAITLDNHVLILGWTNRTIAVVEELLLSQGRVRRFLRRVGAGRLHIVILTDEVKQEALQQLRDHLGSLYDRRFITLRTGNALNIEHLKRVDFLGPAVIIIPGSDFVTNGSEVVDTWTIKTLLSISNYGQVSQRGLPAVVAEVFDSRKLGTARTAYKGPLSLVASDAIVCRLIAQNVRHVGLSHIYNEMLTHGEGSEIYVRQYPQFANVSCEELHTAFPKAVLMGVLRPSGDGWEPHLNPLAGFKVQRGDRFVFLSQRYEDTEPEGDLPKKKIVRQEAHGISHWQVTRRILVLGWSRKVPVLLKEFGSYGGEHFQIDVFSFVPPEDRKLCMKRFGEDISGINHRHLHGDYTAMPELRRLDLFGYDNIVFLSSDWMDSDEESDARTILGYLLLKDMIDEGKKRPEVLLELMDPDNEKLFSERTGEVIISPLIVSHILAHVALRPELNIVFDELFTPGGAEIVFRSAQDYNLVDRSVSFREIQLTVTERGDTALGVRKRMAGFEQARGASSLNPLLDSSWALREGDDIVVLTTY